MVKILTNIPQLSRKLSILLLVCFVGTLSQYAQRPTDQTLHNRSIPGRTAYTLPVERDGIDGYIALLGCGRIGDTITVVVHGREEILMVFDCAGDDATRHWMRKGNILGEIDYYTAKRWGVLGRGVRGVKICLPERKNRWTVQS